VLPGRPSLTLSKAALKKPVSRAFSASASFSLLISSCSRFSLRSSAVVPRFACRGSGRPSNWYFQYREASAEASAREPKLQCFHRSSCVRRPDAWNSKLCRRHFAILAILSPFAAKCVFSACLTFGVQSIRKREQDLFIRVDRRSSGAGGAFGNFSGRLPALGKMFSYVLAFSEDWSGCLPTIPWRFRRNYPRLSH